MPVIFTAGGGQYGYEFAVTKADAMYSNPPTLDYATGFWKQISNSIRRVGRNPDEFTIYNGIGVAIASSEKEALDRRAALDEMGDPESRRRYLSHMLGIFIDNLNPDKPIPDSMLRCAPPQPVRPALPVSV